MDIREDEADRGLDLARRDGRAVVVRSELGSLGSDTLKDVGNERVEDGHGLVRDTGVGVDLLEDLVDVGRVRLDTLLGTLLATLGLGSGGLSGLLISDYPHVGKVCRRRKHTLAGALEAAAGALEACEAGALEAVADLGAIVVVVVGDESRSR